MKTTHCPTENDLRQLFEGGRAEDRLRLDEQHVLSCAACLAKLSELMAQTSDDWPRPAAGPSDAAADDLIRRLDALRPAEATLPPDATPGDPADAEKYVPPATLGPFQLGELLGAGGVGMVFAATDVELQRPVAVKILRPEHARNAVAHRRFLEEARAAAALPHDHIVPIYRVGEENGVPYLAMPRLEGQSLADELRERGKVPVAEAVDVARQVTLALAAAHDRGIIHRDIKPGNLWREPNGRVRVLDFGLARFMASDARLTQTGLIIGTPAYMAPEQADGDQVDHRCDLFSLGCVLYQMIAGRVPFPGSTPFAVFKAMAAGDAEPLSKVDPAVPEGLSRLVTQLLHRDPAQRPSSASEVLQALSDCHRPVAPLRQRRRLLQTAAAAVLGAVGWKFWSWLALRREPNGELYLPPTASAWVRHGLMDPEKTCTMECWCTPLAQFDSSTHVFGNTSFLVFGGRGEDGNNVFHMSVFVKRPPDMDSKTERVHFRGEGSFEPGRRTHLAIVNNGQDFRLYFDGKLAVGKNLRPYVSLVPSSSFLLGAVNSSTGMRIDEFRASSIPRYMSDFTPAERHQTDKHTTALYHCDETSGQILTDSSGQDYHGTLHGEAEWVQMTNGAKN